MVNRPLHERPQSWLRQAPPTGCKKTWERSGAVIGSTWFWKVDTVNRSLEIGHTWLAKSWQRSAANITQATALSHHPGAWLRRWNAVGSTKRSNKHGSYRNSQRPGILFPVHREDVRSTRDALVRHPAWRNLTGHRWGNLKWPSGCSCTAATGRSHLHGFQAALGRAF